MCALVLRIFGNKQQYQYCLMPGSYRAINFILKSPQTQKVKVEAQISVEESESSAIAEQRDGSDGKWTQQQNFKYTLFVNHYQTVFASKHKRKICKIFKLIAQYLQPRTPTQCRSHFQKLMTKYKSITKLKRYYKTQVGESVYRKRLSEFRKEWQLNHMPLEAQYPQIKETKEIAVQTQPQQQQQPLVCASCQNAPQIVSSLPTQTQFYRVPSSVPFWSDCGQLQPMLNGNYVYWISNLNQQHPNQ